MVTVLFIAMKNSFFEKVNFKNFLKETVQLIYFIRFIPLSIHLFLCLDKMRNGYKTLLLLIKHKTDNLFLTDNLFQFDLEEWLTNCSCLNFIGRYFLKNEQNEDVTSRAKLTCLLPIIHSSFWSKFRMLGNIYLPP